MTNNNIEIIKYKNNLLLKSVTNKDVLFRKINSDDILNRHTFKTKISLDTARLKQYKKKIFLKGLGYKVTLDKNKLIFKLNFSHLIELDVPSYITKVTINKTNLVFESIDPVLLGSFVEKIYNFKPKDSYKGKGFSLTTKAVPLKEIKKK